MEKKLTIRVISFVLCAVMLAMTAACSGTGDGSSTSAPAITTVGGDTIAIGTTNEETVAPPVLPGSSLPPEAEGADYTVTVSPLNASVNNGGKFEGWGTSLCWWANRLGYSDTLAQKAADLFYGDDGLRLNIMRYNIGGGDDPTHTHITRTDSAVPGWLVIDPATGEAVYDYDADFNQLNVLERCVKAAGDNAIVEVFSNSPPYFMTNSGCSSGNTNANVNNLKDDSYTAFAEYLAHVADYIQNTMGIEIASIAPMNEPNTDYWGANSNKQEGCHFDAGASQSKIIVELKKAMEQYELDNVIISASDETNTGKQLEEWGLYSEEAKSYIGRINTHSYGTNQIAELGQLARDEDFVLWMSEVDGNGASGENAGEMGSGLWFSEKIISDISALTPSAWVMWQVIDNHISKDGYNGRQDSGMVNVNDGFWGLAVANHDTDEIILTQKYYAMGQFTRYIRPGYTLIPCGSNTLAAYDEASGRLVIVAVNSTGAAKKVNFDLSQFETIGASASGIRTSGGTNGGEQWADIGTVNAYGSGFAAELKANSVTTYIMDGVKMGEVGLEKIEITDDMILGSTPWNNGADVAAKAFDGNVGTFFDGVENGFIRVNFGEEKEFDVIAFAPRSSYESRMVGGVFSVSNDGKNWYELYKITIAPSGMTYVFLDGACKCKYIRYMGEDGDTSFICNVAEIQLYKKK